MRRRARRSARIGVAQSLVGAALAVLVTAGAASASPGLSLQDSAVRGPAQVLVRRPFQHQRHEDLPCRGCHGAGAAHRTTRVRAPTDCAACHHDAGRALACSKCHTGDAIPARAAGPANPRIAGGRSPARSRGHVPARCPHRHDGGPRLQGLPWRGSDARQESRVRFLSLVAPLGSDGMHELSCPAEEGCA